MEFNEELIQKAQAECEQANITLLFESKKVSILKPEISNKPYFIDFTQKFYSNLVKKKPSKKEPLVKALGKGETVLDLTAGTLKDSFYLASIGYQVTAIERSPVIYLLLMSAIDELSKLKDEESTYKFMTKNIKLIHAEALDYLKALEQKPDVIYFDPMFPEKKKQALSQKSMQLFKALLPASEQENQQVALQALQYAKKRLVIKRPLHAEALTPTVTQRYTGKSIRYDMVSTV